MSPDEKRQIRSRLNQPTTEPAPYGRVRKTPEQNRATWAREIADDMAGNGDSPHAYAIGYIRGYVDNEHVSDAAFRLIVRTVLAALDLAQGGA